MKYIDLHCDTLTTEGVLQVTTERLKAGGCLLQCFAAFISERQGRFARALELCNKYDAVCAAEGYQPVRRFSDFREDKINALLTVEEGGAIESDLNKLEVLYGRGVRLMTLVWNHPNEIGFPNFPDYEGLTAGRVPFSVRETERGLTSFGKSCVERMGELNMLVDVSHGSDALFWDVAAWSKSHKIPFVASHSGADAVLPCARNLTDGQIRALADCGGVVGLDFCADFLSDDQTAEGQRLAILAHAEHIIQTGGEDVLCFGSDFDGIPENAYMRNPADMPRLYGEMQKKFGARIAEKIFHTNAERVFKEVLR